MINANFPQRRFNVLPCRSSISGMGLGINKHLSGVPIYALSTHPETRTRISLYRGVYPITHNPTASEHVSFNQEVIDELKNAGAVVPGDKLIITKGDLRGDAGGTNALKLILVN